MPRGIQKYGWLLAGTVLLAVAVAGIAQSTRAALAQALYRTTKFGIIRESPPEFTIRRAEQAHRLYPYNYFFCIWTAEKAYYERVGPDRRVQPSRLEAAWQWCEKAMALNPYNSQANRLKTRLLARQSPRDALEHWRDYVDWYFWEPYHHAVLVDLYVRVGDVAGASDALRWLEGTTYYAHALAAIQSIQEPEDLDARIESLIQQGF